MNNISLFSLSAFIWGSTWLMITFQLGQVPPLFSVAYRFLLASVILFLYGIYRRKSFLFSKQDHFYIFIQGIMLFGLNYWLTYEGITHITSALAAILSTSIVYFNVIFSRIFLGDPIRREVLFGATVGFIGIIFIFYPELQVEQQGLVLFGIGLLLGGSVLASLGNVVSAITQKRKIPVLQSNAFGMAYASILLAIIAFLNGNELNFDTSFAYLGSLIYLALFGSVIAFGSFLTLLGRIGADKAGYISLVYPVIALGFSTLFEDYRWTPLSIFGLVLILIGNFIAMGKLKSLIKHLRKSKSAEI